MHRDDGLQGRLPRLPGERYSDCWHRRPADHTGARHLSGSARTRGHRRGGAARGLAVERIEIARTNAMPASARPAGGLHRLPVPEMVHVNGGYYLPRPGRMAGFRWKAFEPMVITN
jgi:hypothetical protein